MPGSPRPEGQRLALRAHNLGVEQFGVWAREEAGSTLDAIRDPGERCVVVDLGSLATPEEQALTAEAVLGELWHQREERNPVLIVIDEAHNVCPALPEDPLTALATEHAVRIAAEGRKFGLYLLVSTQRPQKVHENVVSQCDNLVLMRLNSAADAAHAQGVFSFVPPRLIDQARELPPRRGARGREDLARAGARPLRRARRRGGRLGRPGHLGRRPLTYSRAGGLTECG